MPPFLTIGIPNYNYARYIRKCIDSVTQLPDDDIEIVVCDNASTDGSWEVISGYTDARIVRHRHKTTIPPHANFNSCLERARGKYFKLLCSDDWIKPQLVSALRVFDSRLDPDRALTYVGHRIDSANGDGSCITRASVDFGDRWINSRSDMRTRWACIDYAMTTACVLNTAIARKVGGYVISMRPDGIIVSRLLTDPSFEFAVLTERSLACVRLHGLNDRLNYSRFEVYRDEARFILPFLHCSNSSDERRYFELLLRMASANALMGILYGTISRRGNCSVRRGLEELRELRLLRRAVAGIPAALLKALPR